MIDSLVKDLKTDTELKIWHWLAPGQEVVYPVDSDRIGTAKIVAEQKG